MNFVKIPNLPQNEATDVIISGEISAETEYTLNKLGINLCKTVECTSLYDAVKFHPDMIFHHLNNNLAVCEPSQQEYFREKFPFLNVCSGRRVEENYPNDIAYNAARVGNYLICNIIHTEAAIIDFAEENGLEIINVKQGYSKCNICVIAENAIITSDIGIKTALEKFPVDVLLINDDSVLLKGFSHGFFGGAAGKISKDKLVVNGNIKYHKNASEIITFANKYDVEIVSLNDDTLEDIGSIIPILEKQSI